jgi:hypothetical protein
MVLVSGGGDQEQDETAKMVEAEKAKAKPPINKIHQTAVAEADNTAAGSSPNSNSSSNGTSSTSTAVTTTMTREEKQELARRIARERVDAEKAKKWAKARRIARERVDAEKAKEAKAMEVQADAKRKAATDADDGGAGEAKRRKTMATVEERPGSSCG